MLVLQDGSVERSLLPLLRGQGDLTAEPPGEEGRDWGPQAIPAGAGAPPILNCPETETEGRRRTCWPLPGAAAGAPPSSCAAGAVELRPCLVGPPSPSPAVPALRARHRGFGHWMWTRQGRCLGPPGGTVQTGGLEEAGRPEDRHPLSEGRQVLGDLKDGEASVQRVALRGRPVQRPGARDEDSCAGTIPCGCASPEVKEFCPHSPTPSPLLPPFSLSSRSHSEFPLRTRMDEQKGYCLLPSFSDHQVLHHLPLKGQSLGRGGGNKACFLPPPTQNFPGAAHQRCLLRGLTGVQAGHPGLICSFQLLIL